MGLEPSAPKGRPAKDGDKGVSAEGRAAPEPSAAKRASRATAARKLPKIADKADDLEAIKKAVDDAASVGGGLWLSYLFVLFYLAVAAGAVTHADLFLENPVKLPFLNIELPLLAFFFLAPILFLFVHAYTLVHLVFLTDKVKRFDEAVRGQPAGDDGLRERLPSNIFIQFLAGPRNVRAGAFGWLLRLIAWSTLAIAPILLLLLMQVQFLPFHNSFITWSQRAALVVDLVLIWWLWRKILSGREIRRRPGRASWAWLAIGLALCACAVLFSSALATFPGEWQEDHLLNWRIVPASDKNGKPTKITLHDWVFNRPFDYTASRRNSIFSSTLVLPGLNIYDGLKIDDPEKAKWRDYIFLARVRDLKGAILDFASLPKVDFESADLQDASLIGAQLQGARLTRVQLQGAKLWSTRLQDADLANTRLTGASLSAAELQGANLDFAQLQGASLKDAHLQGARLFRAQLQGADLSRAQLQGADLSRAQLQGAKLNGAQLQGAELDGAKLEGASLNDAQLQGASLQRAELQATDLSNAFLWRTNRDALSNGGGASVAAVSLSKAPYAWLPLWKDFGGKVQAWNDRSYQDVRQMLESVAPGFAWAHAMQNIRSLDCPNPNATLASCDPSAEPPPEAAAWRKTLEAASVDKKAYVDALAKVLKDLVCSGDQDGIYVVRGVGFQSRLEDAGDAAFDLIGDLMNKDSKDCPVAAALTDADRANLLGIKQAIEKAGG